MFSKPKCIWHFNAHYLKSGFNNNSSSKEIIIPLAHAQQWLSNRLECQCICYSTGWSDIRDISRVVGIAAVKLHEAKPSVISPLYRKRVEYIPEFHCPSYNILIPWLHNGGAISLFSRW